MTNSRQAHPVLFCSLLLNIALLLALAGCQTPTKRISVRVDGQEIIVRTTARTVGDLLLEQDLSLAEWDRVEPGTWAELGRSDTIRIVRVQEAAVQEPIPFTRQVVKDEALPEGKMQLLQNGQAGTSRLTYRISRDGDQELERQLISQEVITPPRPEIMAVGVGFIPTPVPITGTLAYLANGNAWVIRGSSADKRPVTFDGQLDGRVFELDADGERLLFTSLATDDSADVFNALYMVDTRLLNEAPISLGIINVLYAAWSPDGQQIAYSTADPTPGAPGWKAHNNLWLAPTEGLTRTQIISSISSVYGWWGANWAWNPIEPLFAYATPDAVGLVDIARKQVIPLLQFPVFHTHSEWVWVPSITWSPEGRYLACVVHNLTPSNSEASSGFDLWILDIQSQLALPLVRNVGMWSNPAWSSGWRSEHGLLRHPLAYGVAQLADSAATSGYEIHVMDRDGSNKQQALPAGNQASIRSVEIAWAPDLPQFTYIHGGDLYLMDLATQTAHPLTNGSTCERLAWKR